MESEEERIREEIRRQITIGLHFQDQADEAMKKFMPDLERIAEQEAETPIYGEDAALCRAILHGELARLFGKRLEAIEQESL